MLLSQNQLIKYPIDDIYSNTTWIIDYLHTGVFCEV